MHEDARDLDQKAHDTYANLVAADLFRKHARKLRLRAATLGNHMLAFGLLDAAELAEATATNLETIK